MVAEIVVDVIVIPVVLTPEREDRQQKLEHTGNVGGMHMGDRGRRLWKLLIKSPSSLRAEQDQDSQGYTPRDVRDRQATPATVGDPLDLLLLRPSWPPRIPVGAEDPLSGGGEG